MMAPGILLREDLSLAGVENFRTPIPPLHSDTVTYDRTDWVGLTPILWHGTGDGFFINCNLDTDLISWLIILWNHEYHVAHDLRKTKILHIFFLEDDHGPAPVRPLPVNCFLRLWLLPHVFWRKPAKMFTMLCTGKGWMIEPSGHLFVLLLAEALIAVEDGDAALSIYACFIEQLHNHLFL
jgi:hypothetical protein